MDIRDLNQYIIGLCGRADLGLLGSNEEPLFLNIYGRSNTPNYVKDIIADVASFANHAEEQLFYEFVQNAYDANADSLYFFANTDYLVVLNNGEPFYTNFDIFSCKEKRDGELYNFLAKGKSVKRNDSSKMGQYGQGSKLLYTLLADVSEKGCDDLLVDTLYDQKKGPYLISWYDRSQLANLLQKPLQKQEQVEWHLTQGDDYKNNLLFAKILMSYYPVVPGTKKYFPTMEALEAIKTFESLVDPRRNMHFLNRGTAIIIPLGKGKYEKITSKENLERVKIRLGGFAAITKNQERNEGKTVEHIYVMGEEVERHTVQSVVVKYEVDGVPFDYHFAFNPIFAEKSYVNLFKGLPILETKYQLGFIIDSQRFEVDSSRQRIIDFEKTKRQLIRAFSELVKHLKDIKKSNPPKFDYIYNSIISTQYKEDDDDSYIKEAFKEVFVPFFKEYVRTSIGTYEKQENVRMFSGDYYIPLEAIGVTKYMWIEDSIKEALYRHGVEINEIDLSSLLADADQEKFQKWIKDLSHKDYINIHKFFDRLKSKGTISDYKLFRSNKGNLYSYNELIEKKNNVYYPYEKGMMFGECECIEEILTVRDIQSYAQILYSKIVTNIEFFRKTDLTKDDAANLLLWIVQKEPQYKTKIKREILLLQNWHGNYASFDNLLEERPKGTTFFDNYQVKGYVPDSIKSNGWLLNPERDREKLWIWIVDHWQDFQSNEEWGGTNTHKYIADIKKVYNATLNDLPSRKGKGILPLYLNEEGKPMDTQQVVINNVSLLTEEEYEYLGANIPSLELLPYEYCDELMDAPFLVKTIQLADLVNNGMEVDKELLRIFIKLTDSYLNHYRTQQIGKETFLIAKASINSNYFDNVKLDLVDELKDAGLYHVPDYVQQILCDKAKECWLESNEPMLIKAINNITSVIKLLPFVKKASPNVVLNYFNKLKLINIDGNIAKEDLRWQVIEFAIKRQGIDDSIIETLFQQIRHLGRKLPAALSQQYFKLKGSNNVYDVYELDEDYMNDDETIESFFSCLPSQKEIDSFKKNFYTNREKEIEVNVDDIYMKLCKDELTIAQLRFCLDYSIINNCECDLHLQQEEALLQALDMIFENGFKGFDKYFNIPGVDYDKHIFAVSEILNKDECLPNDVYKWLSENKEVLTLFTKLKTAGSPYVKVRQALLNNERFPDDFKPFSDIDKVDDIDAMLVWAIAKDFTYVYGSERYNTMLEIIEKLPSAFEKMPLLKYTGEVKQEKGYRPKPTFILERCQKDCSFLSTEAWAHDQFQQHLCSSNELASFIRKKNVYLYRDKDLLFNHRLNDKPIWEVQTSVNVTAFPEYNDTTYEKWKKEKESDGKTIHISDNLIEKSFNIIEKSSDNNVFYEKMSDNEYGYDLATGIVIHYPNDGNLSVMKTIATHIENMSFFKGPFIHLQALQIEEMEQKQDAGEEGGGNSNIDLTNSKLTEKEAQKVLDNISPETADSIGLVNDITRKMTKEDLEKIIKNSELWRKLMKLNDDELERLLNKNNSPKEEKEAKVSQIVGFIGELIYCRYLEKKNKTFDHAAIKGVGEYDFEITSDDLYVDVKTTVSSLKDGTVPFYLHRSQAKFLQENPNAKYYIIRISLTDLNLKGYYQKLRDIYGPDANPMANNDLKKKCEDIADNYWKSAQIKDFEEQSPGYTIKIGQI